MAGMSPLGQFYFFLLGCPLTTFVAVSVFLLLQIGLYYFKSKLLVNTYLVLIHLISFPWLFELALDILGAVSVGEWSLVLELLLPTIHLFLFPIVSILIYLHYRRKLLF